MAEAFELPKMPKPGSKVRYKGEPWHVLAIRVDADEMDILCTAHILPVSDMSDESEDLSSPDYPDIWVNMEEIDGFGA